eukprot:s18_g17.t1
MQGGVVFHLRAGEEQELQLHTLSLRPGRGAVSAINRRHGSGGHSDRQICLFVLLIGVSSGGQAKSAGSAIKRVGFARGLARAGDWTALGPGQEPSASPLRLWSDEGALTLLYQTVGCRIQVLLWGFLTIC